MERSIANGNEPKKVISLVISLALSKPEKNVLPQVFDLDSAEAVI